MAAAKTTVLCIDDDERTLSIRAQILRQEHYRVLTALTADEGLRLSANEAVDAIVLDYFLPGTSGAEVATALRKITLVPILLLSSAVYMPDDARGLVDGFCAKIDGPVIFLDSLRDLLDRAPKRHKAANGA
ncbi:MAG: response regulator [Terriglobales bacterium]